MRALPLIALVCCLVAGPVVASARQAQENTIYKPGNGVTAPVVIKEAKPQYTADALHAGVQGTVSLECVVLPDGTVGEVRVTKALDPGLDQEAIKAARQWTFKPGLKDGKPVPVRVSIELTFSLRDKRAKPPVSFGSTALSGADGGVYKPGAAPIYKPGNGVTAPIVVKEAKPHYTADAMRAKIQGTVKLECVVEADGRVGDVEVTMSLDPELDQEAVKTVRQWQFEPGKKGGQPVRVRVSLEMTFSLK